MPPAHFWDTEALASWSEAQASICGFSVLYLPAALWPWAGCLTSQVLIVSPIKLGSIGLEVLLSCIGSPSGLAWVWLSRRLGLILAFMGRRWGCLIPAVFSPALHDQELSEALINQCFTIGVFKVRWSCFQMMWLVETQQIKQMEGGKCG